MTAELKAWRKDGRHLPEILRDFHDQKDLFKTIHEQYRLDEPKEGRDPINWVQAHIYTMDAFLWFMAAHGWTLQRNQTKRVKFYSLEHTLNTTRAARDDTDAKALGLTPFTSGESQ